MSVNLITGAAGFLGHALAKALLEQGEPVRAVDRRPYPADLLQHAAFDGRHLDLREPVAADVLDGVTIVYHLAASTGVSASWGSGFSEYLTDNVLGTQSLMSALADQAHINRVIFASSGSIYGNAARRLISEETPTRPYSPYAVTKKAAEDICMAYHTNFGVPVVALRLFYVVGPGQRDDVVVYRMIDAALRGESLEIWGNPAEIGRDFVCLDDVVAAFIVAGRGGDELCGEQINIGSGSLTTLASLRDTISELTESGVATQQTTSRAGFVSGAPADISKAASLLGWHPKSSLADGLADQIRWQRKLAAVA